jgi:hypothetical protein
MDRGDSQYVLKNADLIRQLPREEPFLARETPVSRQQISVLRDKCIIEKAGERDAPRTDGETGDRRRTVWAMTPGARERLEYALAGDRPAELPCGHAGWKNPRDCEGLRCKTCGAEFPKEVVR